ncbi:carbohydrate kinase family protein [Candidatus Kuenenbacteria bacterium]|nr:carbohydrate kinase family protein [Candidatus Kuenenbacteria bacterium]
MKLFDVVTVGSALKDIMFYSDEISIIKNEKDITRQKLMAVEYGAKLPISEVFVNYGGGALNTAVGLKNFGLDVSPMVNVGRDQVGKEIFTYLKNQKINTSLIRVDKTERTGFSIVMTALKDKEHTIFTYKGASNNLEVHNLRNFRTKWFYVSSLTSKSWALEFDKIARQKRRNVKIAWNPGSLQLQEFKKVLHFLPSIEVLILNKDEAIELVKKARPRTTKKDLNDSKYLLTELKNFGSQKVVITQGSNGVVAIDDNEKYYYHRAVGEKRRIVDTVGAGDSFSSGLVAGLVKKNDFDKALKLAIRNSAHVLYRIGAQNGLLKIKL